QHRVLVAVAQPCLERLERAGRCRGGPLRQVGAHPIRDAARRARRILLPSDDEPSLRLNAAILALDQRCGGEPAGETRVARRELVAGGKRRPRLAPEDRKSTRLNSSHVAISYAVFCL